MMTDHQAWLDRTVEKPMEPLLPICDAHHHMWDRPGNRYMPDEFLADTNGNNIVSSVFIDCRSAYRTTGPEAMRPVGETEFIQQIASQNSKGQTFIAAGIVGHADLRLGETVRPVLEAHVAAGKGLFKGIRHSTCWDPSPDIRPYMNSPKGLLMDGVFRQGFAQLGKLGLSFDAWLYFHQMLELADVARAFPETRIVLDHIGGPIYTAAYVTKRDEVTDTWRKGITELSGYPNVYIKLGGMGMVQFGFGWHERPKPPDSVELARAMAPYYLFCIEKCGVQRCLFESNFPVDKVSYSYTVMWNAFKRIVRDFTPTEKAALFHDTAVAAYGLDTSIEKR
jgi:predicted TIM-barrel fold metal-dependent hydrolase